MSGPFPFAHVDEPKLALPASPARFRSACVILFGLAWHWSAVDAVAQVNANVPPVAKARATAQPRATDFLGDPLPVGARLRLGTIRFRHPTTVVELALSPDEKTVVSAGRQLIAWDAATGVERWRNNLDRLGRNFSGASYGARLAVFAPDGSEVFTPGGRGEMVAWDAATGKNRIVRPELIEPPQVRFNMVAGTRAIDVSPVGQLFASGGAGGVVVFGVDGATRFTIENVPQAAIDADGMNRDRLLFGGHYSSGQFSPNGKLLAVVTSDAPETIRLVDAATGDEQRRIKLANRLVRLVFSPDGHRIAATERDNAVRLYDVATGEPLWSHTVELTNPYENYTSAIAFAPDGRSIAACATDKVIYLLDPATGAETARLEGHTWYPWALAFTADSRLLYSAGWDGAIRRWDIQSKKQLPPPAGVRATGVVAASPEGDRIAYEDDSGMIRLVNAADGAELGTFQEPGAQYSCLLFSPNGQRLAGGGTVGDQVHLAIWDLADGRRLHRWDWAKGRDPHSEVEALAFTPDGQRIAAAVFRQSAAYLWELAADRQIAEMKHGEVYGLSISPDGATLATAGWDSVVRLWDTASGELQSEVDVKRGAAGGDDLRMYTICYSPLGELAATAHMNGEVWVWNARDMSKRTSFKIGGSFSYGSLAFSPDGAWLAVGTSQGRVALWDPYTGQRVWEMGSHQENVYTVGFGRDGKTVVSGADDGLCYVWNLRPAAHPLAEVVTALWKDLSGDNAGAAYRAMWALAETPDDAVDLLAENLRPVTTTEDTSLFEDGLPPSEARRRQRLLRLVIDKDPEVERRSAVHRGVALLAQIGTPAAMDVLRELADRGDEDELGRLATAALAQLGETP